MQELATHMEGREAGFDALDQSVQRAAEALGVLQRPDGHWLFELEADVTIPAEYVLLVHYLGEEPDTDLEAKIGHYLLRRQQADDGWPLFAGGTFDISASVKAYFALKMIGHDPAAPAMRRAREAILAHGGAAATNVFTRLLLALYGILPWSATPEMPVEIMLLPRWFPFHLSKISYWARTVIVPLLVLQALKPRAKNPRGIGIDELFLAPPQETRAQARAPHQSRAWAAFFHAVDRALKAAAPLLSGERRERAIEAAIAFVRERLNGEDGLGGIFPAMANAVMMFDALGYGPAAPERAIARQAVDKLLLIGADEAYCQPCLSPVWDTVLAGHALLEAGGEAAVRRVRSALDWLAPRQVLDCHGDWAVARPDVRPGGWAFQYANPHYPDLDDTAVVAMAITRMQQLSGTTLYQRSVARAREWLLGLQARDGGWGAFDADNDYAYLNNIPFADHGALLDPPSPDLTARCLSLLALEPESASEAIARGVAYLRRTQSRQGSWFGRWGVNHIYGTWSVLSALNALGLAPAAPEVRHATLWLMAIQNPDGGWGESCDSYRLDYDGHRPAPSSASQTAWALLGLMAAGEAGNAAVARGIAFLQEHQDADGLWTEEAYTGTGFPRVFYLRYHGYPRYFPLLALARYRNLRRTGETQVAWPL